MRTKVMISMFLGLMFVVSIYGFSGNFESDNLPKPEGVEQMPGLGSLSWEKVGHGISEAEVTAIAVSVSARPVLYAGTSKAIYRLTTGANSYLASLYLEGSQRQVNDLYVDGEDQSAYAATDSGLYVSRDEGKSWKKIYFSKESKVQQCLCVVVSGARIFLGTSRGLLVSDKNMISWKEVDGYFKNKSIFGLCANSEFVYVALGSHVYQFGKDFTSPKRVFSLSSHEIDMDISVEESVDEPLIRCLVAAEGHPSGIWIVSAQGIFYSDDSAQNWTRLGQGSLSLKEIRSAVYAREMFFIAGEDGAYVLRNNIWQPIYQGAETSHFNHLAKDAEGDVYAATDKGVFHLVVRSADAPAPTRSLSRNDESFANEPTIRDVQKMAIDYAQVDPEKIKQWQVRARNKAWLPDFSIGVNGDKNRTLSDNVYGSYTGGGQSYVGPRDKTFYNNFGWDASLSWDLGELIWTSDQTSIDSRSKLMTELREDILNEVTRLYFERRRLQYEILRDASNVSDGDMEKNMRLEELTALIDALTGGQFSHVIFALDQRI